MIGRMLDVGFIDRDQAEQARAEPLVMRRRAPTEMVSADYFVEEVRRELIARHGEDFLYQGGLSIRTTVSPTLQAIADQALRDGLIAYDRRHGWRGPETQLDLGPDWPALLGQLDRSDGLDRWQLALVLEVDAAAATIGLIDGATASLPLAELTWARRVDEAGNLGPQVERADQVLGVGDVVWVEPVAAQDDAAQAEGEPRYALRQPPEVEGAIVALDPHTGRVLAMTGGFSYARSVFNRATQALRQPGSALKPFIYLAALENGFTPSSILLDAPIVIDQGPGLGKWKPANYSRQFYGPSTLRLGIEKSRNVMTVRLAQAVGMDRIIAMAARFGLERGLGYNLASALGSNEVSLLQLTTAYAMLVNGGRRIEPALIERIQDRHGDTVDRRDERPCSGCQEVAWQDQPAPILPDDREEVVSPALRLPDGQPPEGRGRARHRSAGARPSTSRSPARPGPRTTVGMPGSSGSRRIWWSACSSDSTSPRASAIRSRARARRCRSSSSSWRRRSRTSRRRRFGCRRGSVWSGSMPRPGCCPARARRSRSSRRICPAPSRPRPAAGGAWRPMDGQAAAPGPRAERAPERRPVLRAGAAGGRVADPARPCYRRPPESDPKPDGEQPCAPRSATSPRKSSRPSPC